MPPPLFVVLAPIPDQDYDVGQVIGQGRIKDRHIALHLSLRLIRPLHRPATLVPCDACDVMFADPGQLADHVAKRHPLPVKKGKAAATKASLDELAPVAPSEPIAAEQEAPVDEL